LLNTINSPEDLRKIQSTEVLEQLASEIRDFLVDHLSEIDHAHFSANLGVVEITLALHYVFQTPHDELFWDIGHQGYVHKILTGRRGQIPNIRTKNAISGFLSRAESNYDVFGAGHAGTSISAALGAAVASKLAESDKHHVAVIGDASLACGMAFEALNHLTELSGINFTLVINDNQCSIDPSIGGLSKHLQILHQHHEEPIFTKLGITYHPPVDGHDLSKLIEVFRSCKANGGVQIIHCITKKGKGFEPAERGNVAHWHAPGKFDKLTGKSLKIKGQIRYQDVFAQTLITLAEKNEKIVAITAGMLSGTSLNQFKEKFADRCFDVGIAEQHAVTFAAGLATQGFSPFCAIYSTFLQRALDQVIHDVALQKLPVIFCVDRAGLVGHDGATHQGIFDLSFLRAVPNLIIASPSSTKDLRNLIYTAQLGLKAPMVIRYPRGSVDEASYQPTPFEQIELGKSKILETGEEVMIIGLGTVVNQLKDVRKNLLAHGLKVGVCDALFLKPLDAVLLRQILKEFPKIVTVEEHVLMGGFGSALAEFISDHNYKIDLLRIGIPDEFVDHATQAEQRKAYHLDAEGITMKILTWLKNS
jgi:1-deoxy-D-xylulose-5-phosphate synthase